MARAQINISDRGYKALLENVAAAKGRTMIRAGIFEGPPRQAEHGAVGEQLTNAEIGAVHEFGLGHVPERSFIRSTVDQHQGVIHDRLRTIGHNVFSPRGSVKHEAMLFGEWFVGQMKQRIRDGIDPPDAPETIERKGSSTPLIDEGQLWGALTYDVKQGAK